MTTPADATSVTAQVVVGAPIERAFSVFTDDFGRFKPPEHNLLGVDIAETQMGGLPCIRGLRVTVSTARRPPCRRGLGMARWAPWPIRS